METRFQRRLYFFDEILKFVVKEEEKNDTEVFEEVVGEVSIQSQKRKVEATRKALFLDPGTGPHCSGASSALSQ